MTLTIALRCLAISLASALFAAAPGLASEAPFAEEIRSFGIEDEIYPSIGCEVLFVGSSSFHFWSRIHQDFAGHRVLKRGFGGATIADINHYFGSVVGRYRPSQIVFYAGENDINSGKPVATIMADFQNFLDRKTKVMGSTPVIFVSIKPSIARSADFALQTQVNSNVGQLARQRADLTFVDIVHPMLRDGKPHPDLFISDRLHMNEKGYALWRKPITRALANKRRGKPADCAKK